MTLDLLDAAFLQRWNARPVAAPLPGAVGVDRETASPAQALAVERHGPGDLPAADRPTDVGVSDGIVDRLLTAVPRQWQDLAERVEAARRRGRRVIAIAGSEGGEGRTTTVSCLASVLRSRGGDVVCVADSDSSAVACEPLGGGAPHDKRIVLVDAGIWFPPGPIRRSRLVVATLGCDAAILVRRSGGRGGCAREAALESLGIEVLGEVVTFVTGGDEMPVQGARTRSEPPAGEGSR